jgi:hypothetical protein
LHFCCFYDYFVVLHLLFTILAKNLTYADVKNRSSRKGIPPAKPSLQVGVQNQAPGDSFSPPHYYKKNGQPPKERTVRVSMLFARHVSEHKREHALHAWIYLKLIAHKGIVQGGAELFREYAAKFGISERTARRRINECVKYKWCGYHERLKRYYLRSTENINALYTDDYENGRRMGNVIHLFSQNELENNDIRDMVFSILVSGKELQSAWRIKKKKEEGDDGDEQTGNTEPTFHDNPYSAYSLERLKRITGKSVSTVKRRKATTKRAGLLKFKNKSVVRAEYHSMKDAVRDWFLVRCAEMNPHLLFMKFQRDVVQIRYRLADEIIKYLPMCYKH